MLRMRLGSKEQLIPRFHPYIKVSSQTIIATTLTILVFVGVYNPSSTSIVSISKRWPVQSIEARRPFVSSTIEKCDLFTGQWVPNNEGPYYTNDTCWAIHEHQNCMKYGRPDVAFMKWRWKPDACELPIFDPVQFLNIVRNKTIAFVGDSVGRNHLQSLICLLSKVEYPIQTKSKKADQECLWEYRLHNFTIASFWAPFLVKSFERNATSEPGVFNLYLDEPDETWTTQIDDFDYVIINSARWFGRSSVYYENGTVSGCRYCRGASPELSPLYGYRRAFRTAFKAINSRKSYKAVTLLRTIAPSHFENGAWDKGGDCLKTTPLRPGEGELRGEEYEQYLVQLEELEAAMMEGRMLGRRYGLMDATRMMYMRPDGHPSRYGRRPNDKMAMHNDCVHWCLPGPIDALNDLFLEMLKRRDWDQELGN